MPKLYPLQRNSSLVLKLQISSESLFNIPQHINVYYRQGSSGKLKGLMQRTPLNTKSQQENRDAVISTQNDHNLREKIQFDPANSNCVIWNSSLFFG